MTDYDDIRKIYQFLFASLATVLAMILVCTVSMFALLGAFVVAETCDYTGQQLIMMFSNLACPLLLLYVAYNYIVRIATIFQDDFELLGKQIKIYCRAGRKAVYEKQQDEL